MFKLFGKSSLKHLESEISTADRGVVAIIKASAEAGVAKLEISGSVNLVISFNKQHPEAKPRQHSKNSQANKGLSQQDEDDLTEAAAALEEHLALEQLALTDPFAYENLAAGAFKDGQTEA